MFTIQTSAPGRHFQQHFGRFDTADAAAKVAARVRASGMIPGTTLRAVPLPDGITPKPVAAGWMQPDVVKLTARQREVLQGVTRAGGIALHLQAGRTQAVIRNLIKKGLLAIASDGRVRAT